MDASTFEQTIAQLTRPLNGQYPRSWMTSLTDPLRAEVFVVGRNQATGLPVAETGSHDRYLDALFNRRGSSCRGLYEQMRRRSGRRASTTRQNIDGLTERLGRRGVRAVLETNVICYSTPMSSDLQREEHGGGRARGTAIFRFLLESVRPSVLIAHGTGTVNDLGKVLGRRLPEPDPTGRMPVASTGDREPTPRVFVIPSLAPPASNRWAMVAGARMDELADVVARMWRGDG